MIIGNPSNFAILIDVINEWEYKDPYWIEGVFDFIFQHHFFSKKLNYYTLAEFYLKNEDGLHSVDFLEKQPPQNKTIFFMQKEMAFREMLLAYNPYMFNIDNNEDDEYQETTDEFILFNPSMKGFWVTFVSFEEQVRILAAQISDLNPIFDNQHDFLRNEWVLRNNFDISEAVIHIDELEKIKIELNSFFKTINQKFFHINNQSK